MSHRPTLLIVSYHFAPSPLVGAKRFSFLAREFARLGFDVHIVTNAISESPHGREDSSLPVCGTVHRVDAPFDVPLKGGGHTPPHCQCRASAPAGARGPGVLLGARRHAQGARGGAQTTARHRHRHLAAARGG